MLSKTKKLAVVKQVSKTGSCLARLTASQWGSKIFSITTDYLSNLAAGPLDEFHLVVALDRVALAPPPSHAALMVAAREVEAS